MSKALRLSEKWFRRGLWLVAVVFASFLIGLGGTIVGDLPKVERPLQVDDFLDKAQARALRDTIRAQREAEQDAQTALEQAQLQHRKAISDNQAERETFNNWLATRRVTERADHDPEVLERTRKLDLLKQAERQALRAVEAQQLEQINDGGAPVQRAGAGHGVQDGRHVSQRDGCRCWGGCRCARGGGCRWRGHHDFSGVGRRKNLGEDVGKETHDGSRSGWGGKDTRHPG